jgi:hypothetical protein
MVTMELGGVDSCLKEHINQINVKKQKNMDSLLV